VRTLDAESKAAPIASRTGLRPAPGAQDSEEPQQRGPPHSALRHARGGIDPPPAAAFCRPFRIMQLMAGHGGRRARPRRAGTRQQRGRSWPRGPGGGAEHPRDGRPRLAWAPSRARRATRTAFIDLRGVLSLRHPSAARGAIRSSGSVTLQLFSALHFVAVFGKSAATRPSMRRLEAGSMASSADLGDRHAARFLRWLARRALGPASLRRSSVRPGWAPG